MRLTYKTRAEPAATEQTPPTIEPYRRAPAAQLAELDALFAVSDPARLETFTRLPTLRQQEAELRVIEMAHQVAVDAISKLERTAAEVADRIANGKAMIAAESTSGQPIPPEWAELLAELENEHSRLRGAIVVQRTVREQHGSDYPFFLAAYETRIGGEPLEEYAQEKMSS